MVLVRKRGRQVKINEPKLAPPTSSKKHNGDDIEKRDQGNNSDLRFKILFDQEGHIEMPRPLWLMGKGMKLSYFVKL